MIKIKEYSYEYLIDNQKVNQLSWSMAGGGVRIITQIDSNEFVDALMAAFIIDCKRDNRTILPLSKKAQDYFQRNPEEGKMLKGLDIPFIKKQREKANLN